MAPGSVKDSRPLAMVLSAAGASMMKGSQRTPANARTPCPSPPAGSFTRKVTVSPVGGVHAPSWGPRHVVGTVRRREDAVEDQLLLLGGERCRAAGRSGRHLTQPEAVHEPV